MEKLEKHIRKSLEKREIKPSPQAWNRIATQVEHKKSRNRYWPLGIAASFVLMALLALQFMFSDSEEVTQPTIESNPGIIVATETIEDKTQIAEVESTEMDEIMKRESSVSPQNTEPSKPSIVVAEGPDGVNEIVEINQDEFIALNKIGVSEEAIATSAQAILTEVLAMENDTIQITDAEIDSLLLIAQKQLLAERLNPINQEGQVDAMALLNEVELELFESERNQLFDRLKESFFKLRTAVADRNK